MPPPLISAVSMVPLAIPSPESLCPTAIVPDVVPVTSIVVLVDVMLAPDDVVGLFVT